MTARARVLEFPVAETLGPEQTLAEAAKVPFSDVIVIGYVDERLFWRTSRMTRAQSLWLLETMKRQLLESEE